MLRNLPGIILIVIAAALIGYATSGSLRITAGAAGVTMLLLAVGLLIDLDGEGRP